MHLLLFVCADNCVIDARTNRVSLFNVVEELQAHKFPAVHPSLSVLAITERDAKDPPKSTAALKVTFDDTDVFQQKIEFDFQDKLRCRNILVIQGITFPGPGVLRLELKMGNKGTIWKIAVSAINQPTIVAPIANTTPSASKTVRAKKNRRGK